MKEQKDIPKIVIDVKDVSGGYDSPFLVNAEFLMDYEVIVPWTNAVLGKRLRVPVFFAYTRYDLELVMNIVSQQLILYNFDITVEITQEQPAGFFLGQIIVETDFPALKDEGLKL